ncbi:hypothetical protein [Anthocerotibacter panamensis]|uniref:hypothetical protein n=1 Tax=Anthocerotibacter panamensis TaxID=2857077 RepID=UPI001C405963|nr:hypothetical protein [Anthocerotibacter panamensis]
MLEQMVPVSSELQRLLDRMSCDPSVDRKSEVFELLQGEALPMGVRACAWWNGCYYCKDESGCWHSVLCMA